MRSFQTISVVAMLLTTVAFAPSHSANSGEKRQAINADFIQPSAAPCAPSRPQPAATTQTCCQPATASVQPQIELAAYVRPASPKRLTPQPDALEIRRTDADLACAQFVIENLGGIFVYQAIVCSDSSVTQIFGSDLGPLPGDCANPNGACVEFGGVVIGKTVRLAQKRKPGQESRVRPNALASGPHQLHERTPIGQPVYVKFAAPDDASGTVVVELRRFFVRGTGKSSQLLSGNVAYGIEVEAAPEGSIAKEIDRKQIDVLSDHSGRLKIGSVTYNFITATKLTL